MNARYIWTTVVIVAVLVLLFVLLAPPKTTQEQDPAAKVLADKLYEYGNAAVAFAMANPKNYGPGDERLVFYGYKWLQPEYLPEDFNFALEGATFAKLESGEGIVKTVINVREMGLGRYHLEVELIEFGALIVPADAQENSLRLATRAIRIANAMGSSKRPAFAAYRIAADSDGTEHVHIIGYDRRFNYAHEAMEMTYVPPITQTFKYPESESAAESQK